MAANRYLVEEDIFTEKDQILIEMSARGAPQKEISEQCGLSTRQIQRKLQEPAFRKAVRKFCSTLFEMRMRQVQSHWDKMESCFVEILDDDEADVYAKIAAATQIKSMCFQARELDVEDELDDLRDKIAAIECAISEGGSDGPQSLPLIGYNPDDE